MDRTTGINTTIYITKVSGKAHAESPSVASGESSIPDANFSRGMSMFPSSGTRQKHESDTTHVANNIHQRKINFKSILKIKDFIPLSMYNINTL